MIKNLDSTVLLVSLVIVSIIWITGVFYNIRMRLFLKKRIKLEYGSKSQFELLKDHNFNFIKFWKTLLKENLEDSEEIRKDKRRIVASLKYQLICWFFFLVIAAGNMIYIYMR